MSHTPGPWTVYGETSVSAQPGVRIHGLADTLPIPYDADGREQRANARLISAAPELLAALKLIAEEDDENDEWDGAAKFSLVRDIARAALSKATGV
jgi:hypothetical protein